MIYTYEDVAGKGPVTLLLLWSLYTVHLQRFFCSMIRLFFSLVANLSDGIPVKVKTRKTRTISSLKTAAQSHQRSLVVVFTNNVKFVRVGNNKVLIRAPCQEFYHQPCGFPSLKTLLAVGCFGGTRGFYYIISTHSCCKCLCKVVDSESPANCVCVWSGLLVWWYETTMTTTQTTENY